MRAPVRALSGIVAAGLIFGSAAQGASPEITVAVQGVRVVKSPPDGDASNAFHCETGTSVALVVTEPGGGLVAFDEVSSRLTLFVDDKGKDLTKHDPRKKGEPEPFDGCVFGLAPSVSKNRKYCLLEINVPGVPTRQATTLALTGTLVVKVAKEKKDFTVEGVALRAGTKLNAGGIPLKINDAGKPQFRNDDSAMEIEFYARQSLDAITQIRFFHAAGKPIAAERGLQSVVSSLGRPEAPSNRDVTVSYRLKEAADTAQIVFTCWTDMKEVAVPFDLKVSVGL